MTTQKPGLTLRAVLSLAILAIVLVPIVGFAPVTAQSPARSAIDANATDLPPLITHNPNKGPTGYTVTFRYRDPSATRVQIKGEWYFERPSDLPELAGTPGNPVQTPGLLPTEWQPGDVPIAYPNSTSPNWPVVDMTRNGNGIWTYTTPLPSGVFTYGFYVNCEDPAQVGCTEVFDPGNPPWSVKEGIEASAVSTSQVYIPSNPAFNSFDFSWQMEAPEGQRGTLTHATYSSPGHLNPVDQNYLVIYTPPGYDPAREKPYPTLYLNHGGGGNEMDWSTQGALANIMDNLINDGEILPMIVVNPNATGYPSSSNNEAFRMDLVNNAIPYVEAHYNVSTSADDRAFSGLSAGGLITNQFMLYSPEPFGYYGMMSGGFPPANSVLTEEQAAALMDKSIFVGAGWQDVIFADGFGIGNVKFHTGPQREVGTLVAAGVPVTPDFINGGHNWYVWRILLKDFVTRVAFWPPVAPR